MRRDDELAGGFPRVYLDVDGEITPADAHRICTVVEPGQFLAAGPARDCPWGEV